MLLGQAPLLETNTSHITLPLTMLIGENTTRMHVLNLAMQVP